MGLQDPLDVARAAVTTLTTAVQHVRAHYGDTLGTRRLASDVARFAADLDELGPPAPGHPPGPAPGDLEEISDAPYDESMWSDAEHEGFGAPGRRAP